MALSEQWKCEDIFIKTKVDSLSAIEFHFRKKGNITVERCEIQERMVSINISKKM